MKPNSLALQKKSNRNVEIGKTSQFEFCIDSLDQNVSCGIADRLEYFEILYVMRGAGSITVDARKHSLQNNNFYCMAPGQYRLLELKGNADGYRILISPQFLMLSDGWPNYFTTEWVVPSSGKLDDLIARMSQESRVRDSLSSEIIRSLLKAFMIYLRRKFEGTKD